MAIEKDIAIHHSRGIENVITYTKKFIDLLKNPDQKEPSNLPYTKKIDHMYKALEMLEKCKVSTKSELKARMNDVGAKLSHAQKEIRGMEPVLEYEKAICDKIKALQKLESGLNGKSISAGRLFIHTFSEKEIAHNIAALHPMTPEIRRQLYQKVNSKKLFLKYKFEDISLSEAKAVIDYADGKSDAMPSCLLTPEEARDIALIRQAEASGYSQPAKDQNFSSRNSELDRQFELLTYRYSNEEKELLYSYRDLLNTLASYGITPEQASEYLAHHEARQQSLLAMKKEMIALKNEYKELCRLKGYIDLAENDRFLRGPLYKEEMSVSTTVAESETDVKTNPTQEEDITPEASIFFDDGTLSH